MSRGFGKVEKKIIERLNSVSPGKYADLIYLMGDEYRELKKLSEEKNKPFKGVPRAREVSYRRAIISLCEKGVIERRHGRSILVRLAGKLSEKEIRRELLFLQIHRDNENRDKIDRDESYTKHNRRKYRLVYNGVECLKNGKKLPLENAPTD